MVCAKKILSIIICVLAVSALCALGVFAQDYIPSRYDGYFGYKNSNSNGLPYTSSFSNSSIYLRLSPINLSPNIPANTDTYVSISFSLPFDSVVAPLGSNSNTSLLHFNVGYNNWIDQLSSYISDFSSFVYPGVTGFIYDISFVINYTHSISSLKFSIDFPTGVTLSSADSATWLSCFITDELPVPPDPDPYGSYYCSVDPLSSSFLKFKEVDSFSGLGTDKFFYADSSSPKVLFGKYLDPDANIFSQYNVITVNAICSLSIPNPNYSFPTVSASCIFSNYADPTKAGWSSSPVSTYSNPAIEESFFISDMGVSRTFYSYQCVIYLDDLTNFDYDYLSVIFSTSNNVNGIYLSPVVYNVFVDERSSSSDPVVDVPTMVEKVWDDLTADEVYDSELSWAERAGATWLTGGDVDAIREIIDSNTGIWGDYVPLTVSLDNLYSVLTYSGTSGSIMLPSATIPWGDSTLHLWDSQQIPFNYFIDNLPSQLHIIFAFIVLFSYLSVVGTLWVKLFINMFKGNYNF